MKRIHLDFTNRIIVIETDYQNEPDVMDNELKKAIFSNFFPKMEIIFKGNNFTFDFEKETVSINKEIEDSKTFRSTEFVSETEYKAPGLSKRFEEFIDVMGYGEAHYTEREMDYLDTIGFLNNIKLN